MAWYSTAFSPAPTSAASARGVNPLLQLATPMTKPQGRPPGRLATPKDTRQRDRYSCPGNTVSPLMPAFQYASGGCPKAGHSPDSGCQEERASTRSVARFTKTALRQAGSPVTSSPIQAGRTNSLPSCRVQPRQAPAPTGRPVDAHLPGQTGVRHQEAGFLDYQPVADGARHLLGFHSGDLVLVLGAPQARPRVLHGEQVAIADSCSSCA